MSTRKDHWENVYATKQPNEVSWTQEYPKSSMEMIRSFCVATSARIIDVGGGDSKLVDFLLDDGYTNVTVLDISEHAIERAKVRLGERASQVRWIVSDILEFSPTEGFDIWHDRAAFHFLTTPEEVERYISLLGKWARKFVAIGTFSDEGPMRCSGLDVTRYSEVTLPLALGPQWSKLECHTEDHMTPFGTTQNFLFCSFERSLTLPDT